MGVFSVSVRGSTKASVSRHGRKKSKKGEGRRRQLGSGGGLEPRSLDTIMEAPELEGEFAEETGREILPSEPDTWGLENDVLPPRSCRPPSPPRHSHSE
jgi:hypothetical protein